MKVALVYDRVNKWGGAERVLLALHELFPDAPLYTSVYNPESASWARTFSVKPSFLQDFPYARKAHELYPLLMPAAFESFSFDEYDVVISVTSEAAKGILTKPSTLHICYCLTPTRYLWSGYEEYFSNPLMRFLAKPAVSYLRKWDLVSASRPDVMVGISEEVRERIENYYQRDSELIHPPVSLFDEDTLSEAEKGEYYLVVSRLVSYKRVDLAIKACNQLKKPLKIVGTGSELERLKLIAGPTVEFLGSVNDEVLIPLYQKSKAILFPGFEDFGIVMVEALGFGKPVISYHRGGARDIMEDTKTGLLLKEQSAKELVRAIQELETMRFDPKYLKKRARMFSKQVFQEKMKKLVTQLYK